MVMYTFNSFNLLTPKHELIQDCLKIKAIHRNIRAYYDLRDDIMITFFFRINTPYYSDFHDFTQHDVVFVGNHTQSAGY